MGISGSRKSNTLFAGECCGRVGLVFGATTNAGGFLGWGKLVLSVALQ